MVTLSPLKKSKRIKKKVTTTSAAEQPNTLSGHVLLNAQDPDLIVVASRASALVVGVCILFVPLQPTVSTLDRTVRSTSLLLSECTEQENVARILVKRFGNPVFRSHDWYTIIYKGNTI